MITDKYKAFFNTFSVLVHSMACQSFILTKNHSTQYEETDVYGHTQLVSLHYDTNIIVEIAIDTNKYLDETTIVQQWIDLFSAVDYNISLFMERMEEDVWNY